MVMTKTPSSQKKPNRPAARTRQPSENFRGRCIAAIVKSGEMETHKTQLIHRLPSFATRDDFAGVEAIVGDVSSTGSAKLIHMSALFRDRV